MPLLNVPDGALKSAEIASGTEVVISTAKYVIVEGFTIAIHNAGEDLIITDGSDNTLQQFDTAGGNVGLLHRFGLHGWTIKSTGFGAKLSTGTTARYIVWYREVGLTPSS